MKFHELEQGDVFYMIGLIGAGSEGPLMRTYGGDGYAGIVSLHFGTTWAGPNVLWGDRNVQYLLQAGVLGECVSTAAFACGIRS